MRLPFVAFEMRSWLVNLGRLLLSPWLRHFQLGADDIKRLKDLADHGLVVYVLRSASILDAAYLSAIIRKHGLPDFTWCNVKALWTKRHPAGSDYNNNGSPVVFLRTGGGIVSTRLATIEPKLEGLIEWCRHEGHQVYLVPVVSIWQRQPRTLETGFLDILFGPIDRPGLVRRLVWLARYAREIRVSLAKEVDLTGFAKERKKLDAHQVARRVRLSIARHYAGEERSVVGPKLKKPELMQRLVVKDPVVQKALDDLAESTGLSKEDLENTARKDVQEIAAKYDIRAIRFLELLLAKILAIIFQGMYVDLEGLKRIRQLSREGPLLLIPSHKSHMDYLLLSYLFKINGLPPPHIAAGINLTFWPMGPLFRRSGAFFLRRSFAGDTVYKVVFQTYLKLLLREGFNIEFFIEGTRSRAGRIMPPRFGMLQMLTDSLEHTGSGPVTCVPIGIDYELLVEQKSIEQELLGKEKKPENMRALLGARKKLRSSFGACYINFGEPVELKTWLQRHRETEGEKEAVERLGYHLVQKIAATATVTESALLATALCIHHKRGIDRASLDRKMLMLKTLLGVKNVRLSTDFPFTGDRRDAVLALYKEKGLIEEVLLHGKCIYMIPDDRRLILDYYKNNLLHHLAPMSIAAWTFHACIEDPNAGYDAQELFDRYAFLWGLIGEQFNRRFVAPSMIEFQEQCALFEHYHWIEKPANKGYHLQEYKPLRALENLTINYFESFYVVLLALREDAGGVKTGKQWLGDALDLAGILYSKGDIWRFESRSKANLDATLKECIRFDWLVPAGKTSKRKRDQQKYRLSENGLTIITANLQTLRRLVIERKALDHVEEVSE